MNYSSGLLKPDCLNRNLEKQVFDCIEKYNFKLIYTKKLRLNKKQIKAIYKARLGADYFPELLNHFQSGDVIFFIVKSEDAINKLNNLVGHHVPQKADNFTIRHCFGLSVKDNVIHGTENEETFWNEVNALLTEDEINIYLKDIK